VPITRVYSRDPVTGSLEGNFVTAEVSSSQVHNHRSPLTITWCNTVSAASSAGYSSASSSSSRGAPSRPLDLRGGPRGPRGGSERKERKRTPRTFRGRWRKIEELGGRLLRSRSRVPARRGTGGRRRRGRACTLTPRRQRECLALARRSGA